MDHLTSLENQEKIAEQKKIFQEHLNARIAELRRTVREMNEKTLRNRSTNTQKIVESLRRTNEKVIARHEDVRRRIKGEALRRDVNVQVNRGLKSLEEFISVLRTSNMTDMAIIEALEDPAISGSPSERVKRASVSNFVMSIQRQLIEQNEFINIAAHELRTPITPILVNAEMLESDLGGKNELIRSIVRNAYRLQNLTQNILDVARIDSGSLQLRKIRFDLNQLVTEIVEDHKSRLGNGAVLTFEPNGEVIVNADRDRIAEVISNLVGNAIKFTTNGIIGVAVQSKINSAEVTVCDTGPGIDPELFPILFSRFGKKSRHGSGMGLGLYISKSIIQAHHGSISANNNIPEGTGATFRFSLPIEIEIPAAQPESNPIELPNSLADIENGGLLPAV
jgi:signal transduction histidine kinase